jgi:hypothetical protein
MIDMPGVVYVFSVFDVIDMPGVVYMLSVLCTSDVLDVFGMHAVTVSRMLLRLACMGLMCGGTRRPSRSSARRGSCHYARLSIAAGAALA